MSLPILNPSTMMALQQLVQKRMNPQAGPAQAVPAPQLTGRTGLRELLVGTGMGMMAQSDQPYQGFFGNVGRALPQGMAMRDQTRQTTALSDALAGAPDSMKRLMEINPQAYMALQAQQAATGPQYGFMSGQDGDIYRTDKTSGNVELAIEGRERESEDYESQGDLHERAVRSVTGGEFYNLDQIDDPDERARVSLEAENYARDYEKGLLAAEQGPSAWAVQLQQAAIEDHIKTTELFRSAALSDRRIDDMEAFIDDLDAAPFLGRMGGLQMEVARWGAAVGMDNERVQATQALMNVTQRNALDLLTYLSGQISEKELAAVQFLSGGDQTLEGETIGFILENVRTVNDAVKRLHREQRDFIQSGGMDDPMRIIDFFGLTGFGAAREATGEGDALSRYEGN